MQVTLSDTTQFIADMDITIEWRLPSTRRFGEITLQLDRSNPLWAQWIAGFSFLNPEGGSLVKITDATLGNWTGILLTPEYNETGLRCKGIHISSIVQYQCVSRSRIMSNTTAGAIVKAAFEDAFSGYSGAEVYIGSITEAAPAIPEYRFVGQPFSQVLSDMMERTGQAFIINDDGKFTWGPPNGSLYTRPLVSGHDLINISKTGNITDRVTEVLARGTNGFEYRAKLSDSGRLGIWRKQVTISVDSSNPITVAKMAEMHLLESQQAIYLYKCSVHSDHWAGLREGSYVQCIMPNVGFTGVSFSGVVTSRIWRTGDTFITVEISPIADFTVNDPIRLGALRSDTPMYTGREGSIGHIVNTLATDIYRLETGK
jgi:hypothetical protein